MSMSASQCWEKRNKHKRLLAQSTANYTVPIYNSLCIYIYPFTFSLICDLKEKDMLSAVKLQSTTRHSWVRQQANQWKARAFSEMKNSTQCTSSPVNSRCSQYPLHFFFTIPELFPVLYKESSHKTEKKILLMVINWGRLQQTKLVKPTSMHWLQGPLLTARVHHEKFSSQNGHSLPALGDTPLYSGASEERQ